MHLPLRKILIASVLASTLLGTGVANAEATVSREILDARLESQIWTTYALSPYLRTLDLNVSVVGGTATLTGKVPESVNKELAGEIAQGVKGIREVDNRIVVQSDIEPKAERGYGDMIDDASITSAIKSKLYWSRHADGLRTEVETTAGKVTLRGKADSAQASKAAAKLALNTRGVVSVTNLIAVVGTPLPPPAAGSPPAGAIRQDISDGWITAKVKSTLLYSTNVSGSDVSVSTAKGVVTLSGKLDSGAEHALAIELAQNVRGVVRVDSKSLRH